MENNIPLAAWFILFIFILFIVSLNIWLITSYKHKNKMLDQIENIGKTIKNPWFEEEKKIKDLNEKINEFIRSNEEDQLN